MTGGEGCDNIQVLISCHHNDRGKCECGTSDIVLSATCCQSSATGLRHTWSQQQYENHHVHFTSSYRLVSWLPSWSSSSSSRICQQIWTTAGVFGCFLLFILSSPALQSFGLWGPPVISHEDHPSNHSETTWCTGKLMENKPQNQVCKVF